VRSMHGGVIQPLGAALHRALNSDLCKDHWCPILGGIDEQLNGKPPFLATMFCFWKLADEGCGVT
jgi:hypothetical protein